MEAAQVAAAGDIPDDDRAAFGGGFWGTVTASVAQAVGGLVDATEE
jgi:hypothetical protein